MKVIVPSHPGVLSAAGLLEAPIEHEASSARDALRLVAQCKRAGDTNTLTNLKMGHGMKGKSKKAIVAK